MWKITILILSGLGFFISGCEGYYSISGTVYKESNVQKIIIDSVSVKIYADKKWFRKQIFSDSNGYFNAAGLTTPFKTTYYIIFEKPGFKTDTLVAQGRKGKTILSFDHALSKK